MDAGGRVDLFHALRKAGNQAVHPNQGTQRDALDGLRVACRPTMTATAARSATAAGT